MTTNAYQANDLLKAEIAERKQAEEKYRDIFENTIEGIFQSSPSGQHLLANPALARMYGYDSPEELIAGLTDIEKELYVEPQRRAELKRILEQKGVVTGFESEIYRRDGKRIWIQENVRAVRDPSGNLKYYEGTVLDITGRHHLELQLRHMQKMESVGRLAGGVAHDFNNLLTVIQGHTGLLLGEPDLSGRATESVGEIALAAERAANLTRQLLTFSRRQAMHPVHLDLSRVVADVMKMVQRILGEDIVLQVHHSPNLPTISADQGMLEQILMNLAVNSRDAMSNGGRLIIKTSKLRADENYVCSNPEASIGHFVCLEVSDTGDGIPAENLPMIFEPFFTTKEKGRGTGLGLATVYGIVKQHQGWIKVYSEVGHGTSFRIFFPATGEKPTGKTDISPTKIRGGSETIFVVEDNPNVSELVRSVLERYGYDVLEASDGPSALELWQGHQGQIKLLLTDLVMPNGMTGLELADRLQSEQPGLKVIYTSGYSADVVASEFLMHEEIDFLQKPYNPLKLTAAVRQALDRA